MAQGDTLTINYKFLEYTTDENGQKKEIVFESWDKELERWSNTVSNTPIIKDLETFLKDEMHATTISDEERDRLYAKYLEMKLALFDKVIELAKTFARPTVVAQA